MTAALHGETFYQTREPDPEWERRLALIAPPSRRVNWLKLRWLPGYQKRNSDEPDRLVQRWVIYEVNPRLDTVPEEIVEDLRHNKSPRERGHWHVVRRLADRGRDFVTEKRWESEALVSTEQWELYRETKGLATLYWIVQGEHGGHRWRLSSQERALLRLHKAPRDNVAAPGNLPYAEPNELTWSQLALRDRLRAWDAGQSAPWEGRQASKQQAAAAVGAEREAAKVAFRWELYRWLELQVRDAVAALPRRLLTADLPAGDPRYNADEDAIERAFIHDE